MRTISCVSVAWLCVAACIPSYAQRLTEERFVEDALAGHPGITAAEAAAAAAEGRTRQAGVLDNPELSWEREDPEVAARQDTWRLTWRLPFDGRAHRVAAADAAAAATAARVTATSMEVRLVLRELFATWYVADERARIVEHQLDTTRRLAGWMRARADEGEAAGVEARRLELEAEVLSLQLADVRAEAGARRAEAANWSDLVAASTGPARPRLAPPPDAVDPSRRPQLVALEHRVAEAEARRQLAGRVIEPPEVSVGWLELRDAGRTFDGPVLGVAWPVPLFDRNQGDREAASAETDRSRAELAAARRSAAARAEAALASYRELYHAVVPVPSRASGDEVVGSVLAAFEAGEASLTDVLDSLRASAAVRLSRLDTLAAALAAERRLEAAIGHPIPAGGTP